MAIHKQALSFGRSCQSPRTGLLHLFASEPNLEAIPLYENFCFAAALMRQKTAEGVYEGKELLERLFAFQAPDGFPWAGNFPLYLHEYPRCWNPLQPLRIAPILQQILKQFSHVLSEEFKQKTAAVLNRLLLAASQRREEKPFEPLWERRYKALFGEQPAIPPVMTNSEEVLQELITAELLGEANDYAARLIHPRFHIYTGPSAHEGQEQGEPKKIAYPLDLAAFIQELDPERAPWSGSIAGWNMQQREMESLSFAADSPFGQDRIALRRIWQSAQLHSFVIPTGAASVRIQTQDSTITALFDLPPIQEVTCNDLVEIALYGNLSSETSLFVEGQKATLFSLGQTVTIHTGSDQMHLQFHLLEGEGEFVGHLSRGNRPFQSACKGAHQYEAYDWKIGLRTLRRSGAACIALSIEIQQGSQLPCNPQ